jgi:sialidase-1
MENIKIVFMKTKNPIGMKKTTLTLLFFSIFIECFSSDKEMDSLPGIEKITIDAPTQALFREKPNDHVISIKITPTKNSRKKISNIKFSFNDRIDSIFKKACLHMQNDEINDWIAETDNFPLNTEIRFDLNEEITNEKTRVFALELNLNPKVNLSAKASLSKIQITFEDGSTYVSTPDAVFRPAIELRAAGQDNCHTYRIPGIITTNKGTLIAVYDNRYTRSKDLQEDIDIGMSRSEDGGETWEPMKVIMDMDEWGGKPEYLNGVGDPAILYDHKNNTIWVAALWIHGFNRDDMAWWVSQPGMTPEKTGQFMLVKSTDDGKTWSKPINITQQIKDPSWQLLLQGPGRGICMDDGTLVFPAQFKADIGTKAIDGGKFTSHSTIIYSKDGGNTWHIGTGAKPNTTEAQVVQLSDGSLMLNMRDDRNRQIKEDTNGRAVAVTNDMGKTWTVHPSSNGALPESNCMASIIGANVWVEKENKKVLFFSNPADKYRRINMTIKASLDEGMTWPEQYHLLIHAPDGFGYSCLTMVDEQHVGIVYEGNRNLIFQKIPVSDIIADQK